MPRLRRAVASSSITNTYVVVVYFKWALFFATSPFCVRPAGAVAYSTAIHFQDSKAIQIEREDVKSHPKTYYKIQFTKPLTENEIVVDCANWFMTKLNIRCFCSAMFPEARHMLIKRCCIHFSTSASFIPISIPIFFISFHYFYSGIFLASTSSLCVTACVASWVT